MHTSNHSLDGLYVIQKLVGPGACRKVSSNGEKMSCAQRDKFFCYGVGQKNPGVGCPGVEILFWE